MYISFFLVLGHLYLSLVNPSTRHSAERDHARLGT